MENLQGGTIALEHRYQVLERADEKFMTIMYRCKQEPFNRQTWLEVFKPFLDAEADAQLFEKIKRYAHRSGQIDAPGVLRTLDYGELEQNIPFTIAERHAEITLDDYLSENGAIEPRRVADLIERIADILENVHMQGYVHGLLVPGWIYLPDKEVSEAEIAHFQLGLALYDFMPTHREDIGPDVYWAIPPELIVEMEEADELEELELGDDFSIPGDVFALSVLAYQSLTGHRPSSDEENTSDVMNLEWERAESQIPGKIREVVEWGLSEEPGARPSTVREFADEFSRALGMDSSPAPAEESEDKGAAPNENREMAKLRSERDPGPSDVLMTLLLFLLIATNLAWYFWVL